MSAPCLNRFEKPPLLRADSISKAFGGVQALLNVSFEVSEGTILGIIGPNGAGKTTLFNVITSAYPPDSGQLFLDRKKIQNRKVHELVRLGIARTFQNVELFENMTALENVMVGQYTQTRCGIFAAAARLPWAVAEEKQAREEAMALLSFVGIAQYAENRSGNLPFGWQRLLEIARALAAKPRLLLLDEPAAGLNAVETRRLGNLIERIRHQGVTILLVEHDMNLTMTICDRIIVLNYGKILAHGTPEEIQSNPAVMAAYLGTSEVSPLIYD
ncbi:MAG TPA: ABC transporter ATP-binding protein [Desulfobacterales bacterium]|nr:ABC transporter ATP-binding protein [Desulfobacterales bacterium]